MGELEPGFYWVRHAVGEDWEPAHWNGQLWVFLGSAIDEDWGLETPFEVGPRLMEPA